MSLTALNCSAVVKVRRVPSLTDGEFNSAAVKVGRMRSLTDGEFKADMN
jgi:hypothetical protein